MQHFYSIMDSVFMNIFSVKKIFKCLEQLLLNINCYVNEISQLSEHLDLNTEDF